MNDTGPVPVGGSAPVVGSADAAVRRAWVWHALFAAALGIPTAIVATDSALAFAPRSATLAIAAGWTALYLTFVLRVEDWDDAPNRDSVGYFVVAVGLAAVLIRRHDIYFLVVYALFPQAFLFLGRWRWAGVAAVVGVLAIGALPRITEDPGAGASVVASAAIAVAIGWFIEGIHGQSRSRGQALDDLGRIHAATGAVAAARTVDAVAAALRTHLGEVGDHVAIGDGAPPEDTPGVVVPLTTAHGPQYVLVITDRALTSDERRRWEAIGPHVGVVLDNLRLARSARTAGVLEERERLAREVHDTLAQSLTSIVMQLEAAEQALPSDLDAVVSRLDTARQTARDGLGAARAFVRDHRPAELAGAPLTEALQHVVDRWSDTAGIAAVRHVAGDPHPLPAEHEDALLRVAQEALANVHRHAAAHRTDVTLTFDDDATVLEVRDDGVGFAPGPPAQRPDGSGFGTRSMRDRIEALGGALAVDSAPGHGTTVRATLPATPPRR